MKHRAECNAIAAKWCADKTVAEVLEACAREAIPCAPVNTYADAARDPHVLARDMLQDTVQEDASTVPVTVPAGTIRATQTSLRK